MLHCVTGNASVPLYIQPRNRFFNNVQVKLDEAALAKHLNMLNISMHRHSFPTSKHTSRSFHLPGFTIMTGSTFMTGSIVLMTVDIIFRYSTIRSKVAHVSSVT